MLSGAETYLGVRLVGAVATSDRLAAAVTLVAKYLPDAPASGRARRKPLVAPPVRMGLRSTRATCPAGRHRLNPHLSNHRRKTCIPTALDRDRHPI